MALIERGFNNGRARAYTDAYYSLKNKGYSDYHAFRLLNIPEDLISFVQEVIKEETDDREQEESDC